MKYQGNYRFSESGTQANVWESTEQDSIGYSYSYEPLERYVAQLMLGISTPFSIPAIHHFVSKHLPGLLPQKTESHWMALPPDDDFEMQTFDHEIHRLRLPQHLFLEATHKECFLNLLTTRFSNRPDHLQYYAPQVEIYFASESDATYAALHIKTKLESLGAISTMGNKPLLHAQIFYYASKTSLDQILMTQCAYDPFGDCWKMRIQYGDYDWG